MDFHDKEFFDRLMALTEENNKILHKIRRTAKVTGMIRIVYWIIIIGISIGAYYYVQPYLNQILEAYSGLSTGLNSIQSFKNPF